MGCWLMQLLIFYFRLTLLGSACRAVFVQSTSNDGCGPSSYSLATGANVTLRSPGYPASYPDNLWCETTITAPAGSVLRFRYQWFELERLTSIFGRCHDQLKLKETVNGVEYVTPHAVSCGVLATPMEITSRTNQVSVTFTSDDSRRYRGYEIIVDVVTPRQLPISSFVSLYPDFAQRYVDTVENWIAAADDDASVDVNVPTTPAPGTSTIRPTTSGSYLRLQLLLHQLPITVSYDTVRYFTSINYPADYPASTTYTREIIGPAGSQLVFDSVNFALEESYGGYTSCRYDILTIDEPHDLLMSYLSFDSSGRYCGTKGPQNLTIPNNRASLFFKSDATGQDRGFNISVRAVGVYQLINVTANATASFTSPNFPQPYPRDTNRTYEFAAPEGHYLVFKVQSFSLEYDSSCQYDSLQFNELDPATKAYTRPLGKPFCGFKGPSLQSSTNRVAAYFFTDSYQHHAGFNITVTAIPNKPMPIRVPADGGVYITSPNYPDSYPTFVNVTYDIKAPEGYRIRFDVVAFNLEGPFMKGECPHDHVRFFERVNKVVKMLGTKYCSLEGPDELLSETNHVRMVFQSDFSVNHSGFNISAYPVKIEPVARPPVSCAGFALKLCQVPLLLFLVLEALLFSKSILP
ncbi:hypothetical protein RvY_03857 [Ramazzottius varieornatus]|uniref:CUB domain-containing protein n=1 Tax=Ramazzottius varieornatus TaxID=947166 RepID=A0A1D1UPI4_RAMVA|nr:hypothetical protein RvY_03857 [Ramazzottius varieornatus]